MLWSIIVGGIIGWLAGKLMGSRGGVLRNIILGIVGSGVGNWMAGGPELAGLVPHRPGRRLRGAADLPDTVQISGRLPKKVVFACRQRPLFQQNLIFLLHFLLKCAILLAINVRRMAVGPCFFPCFVTV